MNRSVRATQPTDPLPADAGEAAAPRIRTGITSDPLSIDEAQAFVAHPSAGAVVVFAGNVRNHAEGRAVAALTYEAYARQAEAALRELASDVVQRWASVRGLWMVHRVGALQVGDAAVVVAASADHRDAAFAAARYGIDTLKATVPIWKQEHWAAGGAHWPGTD